MNKLFLKLILAIGLIVGVSMVIAVGQSQALVVDCENGYNCEPGLYEDWDIVVEYDDSVLKQVEGISEDQFFDIFKIIFVDKSTAHIMWDLGDNAILEAISVKAAGDTFHCLLAEKEGSLTIVSPNDAGISDIRFSIPDASIMWLLGPFFILLGLLGRRKAKN
jgi:hypothetical protein